MIQIYSDGASDLVVGTWACLILRGQKRILLGNVDRGTNNQMEMIGALEGIKLAKERFLGEKITLTSDSLILVKGMNEWSIKWRKNGGKGSNGRVKNWPIWQELFEWGKGVKFEWKTRCSTEEMSLVDKLAYRLLINYQELAPIHQEWEGEEK